MKRDFLAIVLVGGGSSWGRGESPNRAVERCIEDLVDTWSHLFNLDGREVPVNIYDVTGNDKVWWDDCGIYGDNTELWPIEKVGIKPMLIPKKRREAA